MIININSKNVIERDNSINVLIARRLGWTNIDYGGMKIHRRLVGRTPRRGLLGNLPDYVLDLDAMHEAEQIIYCEEGFLNKLPEQYESNMDKIIGQDYDEGVKVEYGRHIGSYTRARAFLMTYNLGFMHCTPVTVKPLIRNIEV